MKKEMKNPLMKAMKAMIRQGVDLKVQMPPNQILEQLHQLMSEKVKIDITCTKDLDVLKRKPLTFPQFVYDRSLEQYGLYTKSAKVIVQMCQGLATTESQIDQKINYSNILMRMVGMTVPPYRNDEASVVIKSHQFFIDCQKKWIKRVTEVDK